MRLSSKFCHLTLPKILTLRLENECPKCVWPKSGDNHYYNYNCNKYNSFRKYNERKSQATKEFTIFTFTWCRRSIDWVRCDADFSH